MNIVAEPTHATRERPLGVAITIPRKALLHIGCIRTDQFGECPAFRCLSTSAVGGSIPFAPTVLMEVNAVDAVTVKPAVPIVCQRGQLQDRG